MTGRFAGYVTGRFAGYVEAPGEPLDGLSTLSLILRTDAYLRRLREASEWINMAAGPERSLRKQNAFVLTYGVQDPAVLRLAMASEGWKNLAALKGEVYANVDPS